jgi:hypothetical protein
MLIRALPLVTALLPIIAIHLSLVLEIDAGAIPACFPYLDGCVSISATGRGEPASLVFKPAMMSQWALLCFYWLFNAAWLRALMRETGREGKPGTAMAVLGCAGALALIVYVTFLGTDGSIYAFMRRFGVYLYFLFTVIAQILLARHTLALSRALGLAPVRQVGNAQMALAVVPFALGILNLVLKATLADPDPAENIIEWIFALLTQVYFLLTWHTWRATGFDGRFEVHLRH